MKEEQWNPGKLLELSGYYWKTCALHAAVKLDVFSALNPAALSAAEVAERCKCSGEGMLRLLNALAAMGLLVKDGERYTNTPSASAFLSRHSERYIGFMIMHHHQLVPSWYNLDQAVKSGQPIRQGASQSDEEWRASFLMGMFNLAMNLAPRVVPLIDLHGRSHLLDLGGGPGTYAVHFCQANPDLKATVFDLPTTRPFAEKIFARFNMAERIAFKAGDFNDDDIGQGYDVAWLSHILHGESPQDSQRLVGKTAKALKPGGMIVIHEFILDNDMAGPLFPALFSLNMLLGTAAGQSYSETQLAEMLSKAGAGAIRRITFDSPNDSSLIVGTV
jgi:SAM-dependent methyltransferase